MDGWGRRRGARLPGYDHPLVCLLGFSAHRVVGHRQPLAPTTPPRMGQNVLRLTLAFRSELVVRPRVQRFSPAVAGAGGLSQDEQKELSRLWSVSPVLSGQIFCIRSQSPVGQSYVNPTRHLAEQTILLRLFGFNVWCLSASSICNFCVTPLTRYFLGKVVTGCTP